jgi:hypothetical protein
MMPLPLFSRRLDVPCTVDVEHTNDSLHAHVDLDGIDLGPGDAVVVHDPPVDVPFGGHVVRRCRATVVQAGLLARLVTPIAAYLELTELYEVGFSDGRA